MARRDRFAKRTNTRTRSGINPASVLRPRKGQTKPKPPKAGSELIQSGRNNYIQEEEEVSTGFFKEESSVTLGPPRIDPLPPNVVTTESSLPYLRMSLIHISEPTRPN